MMESLRYFLKQSRCLFLLVALVGPLLSPSHAQETALEELSDGRVVLTIMGHRMAFEKTDSVAFTQYPAGVRVVDAFELRHEKRKIPTNAVHFTLQQVLKNEALLQRELSKVDLNRRFLVWAYNQNEPANDASLPEKLFGVTRQDLPTSFVFRKAFIPEESRYSFLIQIVPPVEYQERYIEKPKNRSYEWMIGLYRLQRFMPDFEGFKVFKSEDIIERLNRGEDLGQHKSHAEVLAMDAQNPRNRTGRDLYLSVSHNWMKGGREAIKFGDAPLKIPIVWRSQFSIEKYDDDWMVPLVAVQTAVDNIFLDHNLYGEGRRP
ncbi:hypothetical protein ACFQ14_05830 [Pseudahrensia aquimaris]|uniref:Uncharacterized protein n=1 Tax=Pseudahrensia aquimaris TaxID=744461 RepID=A0ABW3FG35_9HYPH